MNTKEQIEQVILNMARSVREMPDAIEYHLVKAVTAEHIAKNIDGATKILVLDTFEEMLESGLVVGKLIRNESEIHVKAITALGEHRLSELG